MSVVTAPPHHSHWPFVNLLLLSFLVNIFPSLNELFIFPLPLISFMYFVPQMFLVYLLSAGSLVLTVGVPAASPKSSGGLSLLSSFSHLLLFLYNI